jgi:ADP-heptose:LPS heptosyltransferase
MPNWLGDIVMALPLIRAIEAGRPDAEITLICQSQYQSLLDHLNAGHRIIVLPSKGIRYFSFFWKLRRQYPDVHFLFTNSLRGDLEAYLCGAPLRLGGSTKKKRKLLSHQALISKEFDKKHQTELWGEYLKFFGLKETIDFTPFNTSGAKPNISHKVICLAPGSSNTPEKRWPIDNWVQLLKSLVMELPDYEFRLVGTSNDAEICSEIYKSTYSPNIYDYSGKTSLVELCDIFQNSRVLLCNDSGAMHLANAMSTSVVALFGPTEPSMTGPVYQSTPQKITNLKINDLGLKGQVIINKILKAINC